MPFWNNKIVTRVLDALLPPLCLVCDEPVGQAGTVCPSCWSRFRFVSSPFCHRCGMPFDFPVDPGTVCAACALQEPVFQKARAAMIYDDASKKLVLGFKHGDRTHLAKAMAAWMHRAGGDVLDGADALAPVPLHKARLFERRYNQSALLAQQIGALTRLPVLYDTLRRVRATPVQGHLTREDRQKNVKGAFAVDTRQKARIENRVVVLIDDVMTTGATVEECARTLIDFGAKEIRVLTLARVVAGQ